MRANGERLVVLPVVSQAGTSPKGFFYQTSLLTLALLLVACAFVWWANVWGNYGDSGLFNIYNDRRGKSEALTLRDRSQLPPAWIVGGSTAYPLLPRFVSSEFGLEAYNLACFWARMTEYLSWLEFLVQDLKVRPQLLIISLETWTFRPDDRGPFLYPHHRRRFLNAPLLFRHSADYDPIRLRASRALDLLSAQQLRYATTAVSRGARWRHFQLANQHNSWIRFESDGSGPYADENPGTDFPNAWVNDLYARMMAAQGRGDSQGIGRLRIVIDGILRQQDAVSQVDLDSYFPGSGLAGREVAAFERLLTLSARLQSDVVLLILPVHPYFEDLLSRSTGRAARLNDLRDLASAAAAKNPGRVTIFDGQDLRSFGGKPSGFHDRLHMKPSNGLRLLRAAARAWRQH
jgi:hypothetical protein